MITDPYRDCSHQRTYGKIGKIQIFPMSGAKQFTSDEPWAAISITTTDEWPKLNKCQQRGLLQLSFADADCLTPEFKELHPHLKLFEVAQAHQILDFVQKYWDEIETLMIHCYAGSSRSPAVGAAIAKIYYQDDMQFFKRYAPNMLVYRTILETAFERGLISVNNPTEVPQSEIDQDLYVRLC